MPAQSSPFSTPNKPFNRGFPRTLKTSDSGMTWQTLAFTRFVATSSQASSLTMTHGCSSQSASFRPAWEIQGNDLHNTDSPVRRHPWVEQPNLTRQSGSNVDPGERPDVLDLFTPIINSPTAKKLFPIKFMHRIRYFRLTMDIMQKEIQNSLVTPGDLVFIKKGATPIWIQSTANCNYPFNFFWTGRTIKRRNMVPNRIVVDFSLPKVWKLPGTYP